MPQLASPNLCHPSPVQCALPPGMTHPHPVQGRACALHRACALASVGIDQVPLHVGSPVGDSQELLPF
eukprot:5513114-Karenia_brevis.AAC.1